MTEVHKGKKEQRKLDQNELCYDYNNHRDVDYDAAAGKKER